MTTSSVKYMRSSVSFKVKGKQVEFSILHNLPDTPGLSLQDAVQNWLARTEKYTVRSLCAYIRSKGFKADPVF